MPGDALRSILGFGPGGRVKKWSSSSSSAGTRKLSTPAAAKWPSSLPRTKPNTDTTTKPDTPATTTRPPPPPTNPSTTLETTLLSLLTNPRLFPRLPVLPPSLPSTLSTNLLLSRARLPPVLSTTHLHAALRCSPSTADRALAALVRAGTVRRVVVPRGGPADVVELVILSADLEGMEPPPPGRWVEWLRGNPGAMYVCEGEVGGVDGLVRGGWVTVVYEGDGGGRVGGAGLVERVKGRAAGTVEATGGVGVVWEVGTGVRARGGRGGGRFRVAVPGVGGYLKLVTGAVGYLGELLGRYGGVGGVMAEGDLKGKWDGGVVGEGTAARAKKGRGQFVGVGEGRTRRWREFLGMEFEWVLDEAVGAGMVEVFETGSVGRGVRRLR